MRLAKPAPWIEQSPDVIARRYNRLAPVYGVLEWLYLLPLLRIRSKSVSCLRLQPGDTVLEIRCGSGRNLPLLVASVGPSGAVLGVDLSPGMLERASALCRRRGWTNVELTRADAAGYVPRVPPDAVLFSFSYSAIPQRSRVLASAWSVLRPGGRLVITDLSLSEGRGSVSSCRSQTGTASGRCSGSRTPGRGWIWPAMPAPSTTCGFLSAAWGFLHLLGHEGRSLTRCRP